jgi:phage/plasmid-like protein (TIGR03299 family)
MAHELDTITGTEQAATFSVIETPWHKLGTVLAEAPSFNKALELGGLKFDVEKRPLTTTFEIREGETIDVEVPENYAVVRTDRANRDGVLGVVGSSYKVLQNVDAFRVLEPLVDRGVAKIETGGALRGGRDVWMMVRFNIDDAKVAKALGDEVVPFGLISNNHNGSRQVTLQQTPIRVVCANTLAMAHARAGGIKVRHTTNVEGRTVKAAEELFANLVESYREIGDQFITLRKAILTKKQFEKAVLDVLAPLPDATKVNVRKDNIAKAAFEKATARAESKRDRLTTLWTDGDGHSGNLSAWEAVNGAIQSLDHDVDFWKADNRLESLFDGTIAMMKTKVTNSVYDMVWTGKHTASK